MEEILRDILKQLLEIRAFVTNRELERKAEKELEAELRYIGEQPVK